MTIIVRMFVTGLVLVATVVVTARVFMVHADAQ
jgi:hypothetical protein